MAFTLQASHGSKKAKTALFYGGRIIPPRNGECLSPERPASMTARQHRVRPEMNDTVRVAARPAAMSVQARAGDAFSASRAPIWQAIARHGAPTHQCSGPVAVQRPPCHSGYGRG
jgi:hypothetical protein